MNKKTQHIVLVLVGLFLLNFAGSKVFSRFDITKDKRYTLSDISTKILNKVNSTVLIKVYLKGSFPSEFQRLQTETQQFLEELQAKNSAIHFQFMNPDAIRKDLIKRKMIPSQLTVEENGKLSNTIIFPWAEIIYEEKTEIVSLLPNTSTNSQEEQLQNAIASLEFSFANAFNNLTRGTKQKIAVLSGNGELPDLKLYSFLAEISKKYSLGKFTLDSVITNKQKTLNDLKKYDLAIIAKPTERFTSEEKLVLDQFIINGGKTLWMIDNLQADTDSLYNQGKMLTYPRDLNLTDLLFSYGVRINNKLVLDMYAAKLKLASGTLGNQTQFNDFSWAYHPLTGANPNHSITKNILPVRLRFATQIDTLKNRKGYLKKTPLLVSSPRTKMVGTPKIIELNSINQTPKEIEFSKPPQLLAVLLEGNFTSAYKNRVKAFDVTDFKDSIKNNKMIIVADGDIARNQILKGKPYDLSSDKWTQERFGNKDFLVNSIDYLLDDNGLINLRNKSLTINLLDKQQAYYEKGFWQFLNIGFPLILLGIFGFSFKYWRKRKYS